MRRVYGTKVTRLTLGAVAARAAAAIDEAAGGRKGRGGNRISARPSVRRSGGSQTDNVSALRRRCRGGRQAPCEFAVRLLAQVLEGEGAGDHLAAGIGLSFGVFLAGLELLELFCDLLLLLEQSRHFVGWIETGYMCDHPGFGADVILA